MPILHPANETRRKDDLRAILACVAMEINDAAGVLDEFQGVLSQALKNPHDPMPIEKLQNLDLLQQTLDELGHIVTALAAAAEEPFDPAVILAPCKLADLAIRLGGGAKSATSSDVEFF